MNQQARQARYRFDRFVLDVQERRLEADAGREVHLRPKTLDTLIYLVEHAGRLVTKQALLDDLWTDAEVTENSLPQCIRELREALGDDQKRPRFIQTVQRAGYRFIADTAPRPVEDATEYEEELTAVNVVVAEDDDATTGASLPVIATTGARRLPYRTVLLAVASLSLVVGVVAGSRLLVRGSALSVGERDWVLIADLDNVTREPALDGAVRAELERELSVSRYVNFVPRGRVADTLSLMRRPPETRITEQIAREICLRDGGIRALLSGTISSSGQAYMVVLRLVDPRTGATVGAFEERARTRDEVLDAIHRLAATVRRGLGEPLAAIAPARGANVAPATTTSLEALVLYSQGLAAFDQLRWSVAETFFDQALARDPEFAIGHLARGIARMMTSRDPQADFVRAASLVGHVTARESLGIQAMRTYATEGAAASVALFESLLAQYPDDYSAHEMLSWAYLQVDDLPDWEAHQAACRRLRPNLLQSRFHEAWVSLAYEGDAEKAHRQFASLLELRPDFPAVTTQGSAGFALWMAGRMREAAAEFARVRSSRMKYLDAGTQITARPYLARFYSFLGDYPEALAMLETNRDMTFPQSEASLGHRFRMERALIYQAMGREEDFERLIMDSARDSVGMARVEALGWLGVAAARRGAKARARQLLQDLEKEEGEQPFDFWHPKLPAQLERAKQVFGLQIEGELLLSEGNATDALQRFGTVLELARSRNALFVTVLSPRVWLAAAQSSARAHAQLGDWNQAVADYRSILDRKSLCVVTDGAADVWIDALQAIGTALERAGRPDEASTYTAEYRALRPAHGST